MGDLSVQGKVIDLGHKPKLLIIKPSSLGDIVHSLPVLAALRRRYPDATIHWAVFKGLDGILQGHPLIDRLIVIDKGALTSGPLSFIKGILSLRHELKSHSYEAAIDLQGLFRSGLMARISGAPIRVGFSDAREGSPMFYTHKITGGTDIHAVERYLKIAEALDCDSTAIDFPMVEDTQEMPFSGEYAVIVPGARWDTKLWPPEKFGELASQLPIKSIIVGGKEDMDRADTIVSLSGGKAVSLAGKTTLRELSGIIKGAHYMVTNDTGPMHIGAAYRVPVIAIFGPTNHIRTGPYGEMHTVITHGLECSPCYRRKCDDLRCMNDITTETVLAAITKRNPQ